MKPVQISVVMLVKEQTLAQIHRALAGLRVQTLPVEQIIIADLNEELTNISLSLQEDISGESRITYVQRRLNENETEFRNLMLDHVTGPYVVFMDAAENWQTDKLQQQAEAMEKHPEAPACYCNGRVFVNGDPKTRGTGCFDHTGEELASWIYANPIWTGGQVLYKLQVLKELGGFREIAGVLADMDALCRMEKEGHPVRVDRLLLQYDCTRDALYWRKQFLSRQALMNDVLYLDRMLESGKVRGHAYHTQAGSAARAGFPLEAVEYTVLGIIKAPIQSCRMAVSGAFSRVRAGMTRRGNKRACDQWVRKTRQAIRAGRTSVDVLKTQKTTKEEVSFFRGRVHTREQVDEILFESEKMLKVPAYACLGGDFSGELVLPDGIERIETGAFAGCHHLTRVVFPDSLEYIEDGAFMDCTALTDVLFDRNATLKAVGKNVFSGCTALKEIHLPDAMENMSEGMFAGCDQLKDIQFLSTGKRRPEEFSERVRHVSAYCFAGCEKLESMHFGKGSMLESVEPYGFYGCSSLQLFWTDSRLTRIGAHAFHGCSSLAEVVMENSQAINHMGHEAFRDCVSLKQFQLSPGLRTIRSGLFRNCKSLGSIRIHTQIKRVEHDAFIGCGALMSVLIENPDVKIEKGAFEKETNLIYQIPETNV